MKRLLHNCLCLALAGLLTFGELVHAETSSSSKGNSALQAAASNLAAASNTPVGNTSTALPPPPEIKQPDPAPQQQQSDRKEGQGAAAAMAAVGAAIAGASCMMMLNEARKMPPGPEKRQTMMMAMQQCAQAAQSAANAAQNKEGSKSMQNTPPAQASLATPAQIQQPKKEEEKNLLATQSTDEEADPSDSVPLDTSIEDSNLTVPDLGLTKKDAVDPGSPNINAPAESYTVLDPLEKANQTFDENAKGGQKSPEPGPVGTGTVSFASSGSGISDGLLKKINLAQEGLVPEGQARGTGKRANIGGGEAEGASGGGGSSSDKDGDSGSAFDQMLASLMGGGAPGGGEMSGSSGNHDFATMPEDPKKQQRINIFEYASYRYQYAAYNEGRVKLRPTQNRMPASVPAFTAAAITGR